MATAPPEPPASRIDGVLLASFGGPEAPEEVMPFLRRVTAGRRVPDDRLRAVARHYEHFGGISPINAQNRALAKRLASELAALGCALPVFLGNRNWHPLFGDVVAGMAAAGHRNIAVVATSGFASQPGCRQYQDDVSAAIAQAGVTINPGKIRLWFDHPTFLRIAADRVVTAVKDLLMPDGVGPPPTVLYSTHSLPRSVADSSGPAGHRPQPGGAYVAQHRWAATAITRLVSQELGQALEWEVVFQSRSGSPRVAWLEPDINQRLRELAARGVDRVVVFPLGFVTDHMEIMWDLDVEARATARELGMAFTRAQAVGSDPRFARMLAELVAERVRDVPPTDRPAEGPAGAWPDHCPAGCCLSADPSQGGTKARETAG